MARLHLLHSPLSPTKFVFLIWCGAILGATLVASFFWASFSSVYIPISSNWVIGRPAHLVVPNASSIPLPKGEDTITARKLGSEKSLPPTFADLPAPDLLWEKMPPAPVPRLDGASIVIDDLFYVFAGYGSLDYVHSHVDVYNFSTDTWVDRFDMPKDMAHSHLGVVTDGRYIYVVSGQYGPQCRPPTSRSFVLDTQTKTWKSLPPLPAPRYSPCTQLWRGRLHAMGGGKENRHTPALEHWSLAVKDGEALEKEWRSEIPIPRGGPHRACVVVNDRLFAIGGQEGDFMAKPNSPIFKCSRRHEVVYADVYMLDEEMKWKTLPPMPKPNSHIECSWVVVNNSIVITGGTTEKHPVTKRMILVGEVFRFNLDTMTWTVIGKLPFRVKTTLTGFYNGWLYFTSGQRDRGPDNPQPREVISELWRTKLSILM